MENGKWKMGVWLLSISTVLTALLLVPMLSLAQGVEMAETFRSEGKIYVVLGVIAIVFLGIVFYLIALDRRISKMENRKS